MDQRTVTLFEVYPYNTSCKAIALQNIHTHTGARCNCFNYSQRQICGGPDKTELGESWEALALGNAARELEDITLVK